MQPARSYLPDPRYRCPRIESTQYQFCPLPFRSLEPGRCGRRARCSSFRVSHLSGGCQWRLPFARIPISPLYLSFTLTLLPRTSIPLRFVGIPKASRPTLDRSYIYLCAQRLTDGLSPRICPLSLQGYLLLQAQGKHPSLNYYH